MKASRNGRPQHPAMSVRGIRPTKARSGISLSNAYRHPARVGLAPSWRTGKGWPCAQDEYERGGNTMLKAAEDETLTLLILLHDSMQNRIQKV